jgi:hypothetical protein
MSSLTSRCTDLSTDTHISIGHVRPRKLWFGFVGSAISWILLGCLDLIITLLACTHQEAFGVGRPRPVIAALFFCLSLGLLAVTLSAGIVSYRNWRHLSRAPKLLGTYAVDRREFMALLGVIVSVTLGMGIVWLALPPLFLDLCWRAR